MLLASYTFSKSISDIETLTTWLDAGTGVAGVQDWNNFRAERSLSSFDSRQRLTVSYVLDLPVGKVRKVLRVAQEPISLETPIGEEDESHLGDFIVDQN